MAIQLQRNLKPISVPHVLLHSPSVFVPLIRTNNLYKFLSFQSSQEHGQTIHVLAVDLAHLICEKKQVTRLFSIYLDLDLAYYLADLDERLLACTFC